MGGTEVGFQKNVNDAGKTNSRTPAATSGKLERVEETSCVENSVELPKGMPALTDERRLAKMRSLVSGNDAGIIAMFERSDEPRTVLNLQQKVNGDFVVERESLLIDRPGQGGRSFDSSGLRWRYSGDTGKLLEACRIGDTNVGGASASAPNFSSQVVAEGDSVVTRLWTAPSGRRIEK